MDYKVSFLLNNVSDGVGRLQMRVQWDRLMLKYNLGYAINADRWDNAVQMCRNGSFHGRKKIPASEINKDIKRHRRAVEEAVVEFDKTYVPTRDELRQALEVALGKRSAISSFPLQAAVFDFIIRQSQTMQWADNTAKKYRTMRDSLNDWKDDATLADLDERGLTSYYSFLVGQGKKNTTLEKYITNLKTFLHWAEKKGGYRIDPAYQDFSPRIKTIPKTIVWLTWDELMLLYNADLSGMRGERGPIPCVNEVRDMFCLSCFTGLRYSDIVQLRHSDIANDKIQRVSLVKTDEVVTVELNKYSREILLRYKDKFPVKAMPDIANATCNEKIKAICKYLKIDAPTTITYYKGAERIEETKPKYKLVSMHTGRRTFICSALEKGISPVVVMKWTGHKSYEEMKPYIDISDKAKETAMKLFDV